MDDSLRSRIAEATRGDYDILGELGRGGMATVFLAHDHALDRRVAIKVLAPHLLEVPGMAERFLLEARIAAALTHPHIIPIHAVRRAGDLLYFVMKYVAGRPLDAIVAQTGAMPVPLVRAILAQVGSALTAAHRSGIIHRDIKPANILIDEQGDAVVADFGIARVTAQPGVTQHGHTVGTPSYMSPEQCLGAPVTGAADQYALGIVAYELLTGRPPFAGDNPMQVMWQLMHDDIPPLASRRADCGGPLAHTVHRMIARRAADRFPSVADALAALAAPLPGPDDPARRALAVLATQRPDAVAMAQRVRDADTPTVPSVAAAPRRSAPTDVIALAPDPAAAREPAAVALVAASGVMTLDDVVPLVATVRADDGTMLPDAPVTWASSDSAVARVAADGTLTAVGIGTATITARAGAAQATLALTVTRAAVRGLAITPRPAPMSVGDEVVFAIATGDRAAAGPPRLVAWTTSHPEVARVTADGRVTALAAGVVELTARAGGTAVTVTLRIARATVSSVRVSPGAHRLVVGEQQAFAAEALNPNGFALAGQPVRWDVSDPAIATVSTDGVLTALRNGQVLVAAKVAGRVGVAKVTVAARSVAA